MKKHFLIGLALLVTACTRNPVSPEQAQVEPQASKVILFDLSKAEDAGNADWRIDGAYSSWADSLRSLGYTVRTITSVTSSTLVGASVLVIPEPQNPFSLSERDTILSAMNGGMGLFMIADHRISDRNNNGWDSPEVFNGWDGSTPTGVTSTYKWSLDSQYQFKIKFSFNSSYSDPVYTATPLTSTHPIIQGSTSSSTDNVTSAGVYVGTSVDVTSGQSLMGANGKTYLATSSYGSGRVVAWGDSSTFEDNTLSNGSNGQYNNWVNLSNANLARNAVKWLAKDL
ncbi:DUF4350 domain-containing protein [Deinococcus roseus]|uniref:DUF4350 domain-containing protein n=1 Tax=Deinococcus roseus TaxID=392414 RepID=A0ABQ2CVX5_9DEIO|nr:DUF4350 domain-containing protein [Deinococcus roseus]GGJ26159.1 hypothetical protein GCM10008938_10420 [Deinococcus roseus]